MRDFSLDMYRRLLLSFQNRGYSFYTFEHYLTDKPEGRFVVLRHDVDKHPSFSLRTAQIENELGIRASYYFRVVEESNDPHIIAAITALGHEIGYHYEDMSLMNGDHIKAEQHFAKWLTYFRQFYSVKTICMHGAPREKYDSRDLWKHCDYHSYGIIGEPYFDIDFKRLFYLTDTGRCWDGYRISVRDKIPQMQDEWCAKGLCYHSTNDLLSALNNLSLPSQLMLTTHPQRWSNSLISWLVELVAQNIKNIVKRLLVLKHSHAS